MYSSGVPAFASFYLFCISGCFSPALLVAPFRSWRTVRHHSLMYCMILDGRLLYGWDT